MMSFLYLFIFIGIVPLTESASCGNEQIMEIITSVTTDSISIFVFDSEECNLYVTQNIRSSQHILHNSKSFVNFIEDYLKKSLEKGFSAYLKRYLNIVLFCEKRCIQDILIRTSDLDVQLFHGVFFRHFSTWFIISPDFPIIQNITFDNVSWIKLVKQPGIQQISCTGKNLIGSICDEQRKPDVLIESLQTLLWMPGEREWVRVDMNQIFRSTVFPNLVKGLNGRQLKASALEWLPFTARHVSKNEVHYEGASIDIFNLIAEKYNFSYDIIEPEDLHWGQVDGNTTHTGILGQINRAEADFCLVPYGISNEREKIVDFTYPILANEYGAIYRQRKDELHEWLDLVKCFTWPVYLCGTAAWSLVLAMSFLMRKFACFDQAENLILFDIAVNIPLRQDTGMVNMILGLSSRILIFSWSLFCFLITTVYIGNLVAFATVVKGEDPFNSLEDLAKQTRYEVGILNGSYGDDLLRMSKDPTLKTIFKKILESQNHVNIIENEETDTLLQRVIDDKFVLLCSATFKDFIKLTTCDTAEMKQTFFPFYSGFLFPPGSPLKDLFERELLNLKELGIIDKKIKKWTPKPKLCNEQKQQPRFILDDLKSVAAVCSALVITAILVLVIEIFYVRNYL